MENDENREPLFTSEKIQMKLVSFSKISIEEGALSFTSDCLTTFTPVIIHDDMNS